MIFIQHIKVIKMILVYFFINYTYSSTLYGLDQVITIFLNFELEIGMIHVLLFVCCIHENPLKC